MPRCSSGRGRTPITLVVIHTSEGATNAASLVAYLDRDTVQASYHKIVDDTCTVTYLPDNVACWAVRAGNSKSLNLCLTAWARWPRSEWLAHDRMLRLAAAEVRSWCATHRIPTVKLSPAAVGRNEPGIIGHWDWTLGKRDGTHTDPGPNFPWDVFLSYITGKPTTRIGSEPAGPTMEGDPVINHPVHGTGMLLLICPVGKASQVVSDAWISAAVTGPDNGTVRFWFQNDTGGISDTQRDIRFANGHSEREWVQVPDGTTMIRVEHAFPQQGTVCLELASR